ncbi:MAG: vitamin K epoxide reductase family protein [Longimicrobiales bacterium]
MTTERSEVPDFSPPVNRMFIAILALLGLLVALYMWAYAAGLTGPVLCGIGDCEAVQTSEFSRISGIPVAFFGVIGYLLLLTVAFLGLQPRYQSSRVIPFLLFCGGLLGLVFSAYLTYLEAYVIHAWCQWCVSSAIIMVLAFLTSFPELKRIGGSS